MANLFDLARFFGEAGTCDLEIQCKCGCGHVTHLKNVSTALVMVEVGRTTAQDEEWEAEDGHPGHVFKVRPAAGCSGMLQ